LLVICESMLLSRYAGACLAPQRPSTRTAAAAAALASAGMATKRKAATIGTHSGTFHCDEALGCWMLKQTEQFAGKVTDLADHPVQIPPAVCPMPSCVLGSCI